MLQAERHYSGVENGHEIDLVSAGTVSLAESFSRGPQYDSALLALEL